MHGSLTDAVMSSGWDNLLLGLPFIALLFCGFFRLDEVFVSKGKVTDKPRRIFSGVGPDGEPMICDPDGRPSQRQPNRG